MNILIVEDIPTNRKRLRAQLEGEGLTVCEAADGLEALDLMERQKMDVVVSDVLMPRMDGYALCREVRAHPRFFALPFIFYTATYTSPADENLARNLGADLFLRKPIAVPVLMEALRQVTAQPRRVQARSPSPLDDLNVTKEYTARLISKLEEKNIEMNVWTAALEATANAVIITDRQGLIVWVNPAFTDLTGFTAQEIVGQTPRVLKSGRHGQAFYAELWNSILSGQVWRREFLNRRKDGAIFHCEESIIPVRSEGEEITHFIGVMCDVSARKTAEAASQRANEELRRLLEHSPAVIYNLKIQGAKLVPVMASENVLRLIGFSVEEALTLEWWLERLHPNDRALAQAGVAETLREGSSRAEYRLRHKDGSYRWVEDNRRLVRGSNGEPDSLAGVLIDVSQRKQADLRAATQHAVTEALADSASFSEAAMKVLKLLCESLGCDVGELRTIDPIENRLKCAAIYHPQSTELREFIARSREMTFARGEGLFGHVWEKGAPAWIEDISAAPEFSRRELAMGAGLRGAIAFPIKLRGETLGVFGFFSLQILLPNPEVLNMLAAIAVQIAQFIERNQMGEQFLQAQKMEAFGQLAGGIAHDFNNLLAVIMGYSNLALMEQDLTPDSKQHLRQICDAGERASTLTRQLLTFSRKRQMCSKTLDLNKVIAEVGKMVSRVLGEEITVTYQTLPDLPTVLADEGMLEQLLMNLVVNARDAMPQGGRLTIATTVVRLDSDHARAHLQARPGEFVRLAVEDTGCGMSPEVQARIFEPFFTTKEAGKGTGLGLATTYGIVKQDGGWIEVTSHLGHGTTFEIFFPLSAEPLAVLTRPTGAAAIRGGRERVLLVEDEAAVRQMARMVLERLGYTVKEAPDGVAAGSVWEKEQGAFDLLLTDMIMPRGLTGLELARQFRSSKPGLPVICSSGYSGEAQSPDVFLKERVTFLQKPYNVRGLAEAVRAVLDAAHADSPKN